MKMKFSPGNAQDIGARSEQQDAFGFSDPSQTAFVAHGGVVAVIADGMGGLAHGSEASHTAVSAFLQAYEAKAPEEAIPDALLRSIHVANDAVSALAKAADTKNGLGTTLAAAVMHDESLYWISAGDSRVYFHRDGHLTCLTADHTYAIDLSEQVEKGEITQAAALTHPERASLTSYLGLDALPRIERSLRPFPVQPGDCVLICSDGLYRALSEEEIAASLRSDSPQLCEELVKRALAKQVPAQDNITVLSLTCQSDAKKLVPADRRLGMFGLIAGALLLAAVGAIAIWILYRHSPWKSVANGATADQKTTQSGAPQPARQVSAPAGGADASPPVEPRIAPGTVVVTIVPTAGQASNIPRKVSWDSKQARSCGVVSIKAGEGVTLVDQSAPPSGQQAGNTHGTPPNAKSYTLVVNCTSKKGS
jgi:PPM family protein phosphatase